MSKQNYRTSTIYFFDNFGKKNFSVLTILLIIEKNVKNILIINSNIYYFIC